MKALAVFEHVGLSLFDGAVQIDVTENPIIDTVEILGAQRVSEARIRDIMMIQPGQIYSPPRLSEDISRIRDLYATIGIDGKVDLRVHRKGTKLVVPARIQEDQLDFPKHSGRDILIWARGKRAREIARILPTPAWSPEAGLTYVRDDPRHRRPRLPLGDLARIQVTLDQSPLPLDNYRVIVLLADEVEDVLDLVAEVMRFNHPEHADLRILIAPTLPPDRPSEILRGLDMPLVLPVTAAVLDTSLVRSPFWRDRDMTSMSRLLAEYVVGGAMLMATDRIPPLARRVDSTGLPLIAFAKDQRYGRMALVSEAAPDLSFDDSPGRGLSFEMFDVVERAAPGFGYLRFSPPTDHFEAFGVAAFELATVGHPPGPPRLSGRSKIDEPWRDMLTAPQSSVVVDEADGIRAGSGVAVIVAEAPSLDVLRDAERSGVSLVRYTDTMTLRQLMKPSRSALLPAEISMPPLHRQIRSAGLFVRGVEPHVIVRLSGLAFDALEPSTRGPLTPMIRRLRATVERSDPADVVVPFTDALDAARKGDELANIFLTADTTRRVRPITYKALRGWAGPMGRQNRYVFSEVSSRIVVSRLGEDEIAGSRVMTMDGDLAVPLLLTSRPFQLWIRTQCQSLGSRFRLSIAALESFPIPSFMHVIGEGVVATPALVLVPERIKEVSSLLALTSSSELWKGPLVSGEPEAEPPTEVGRELARMILADYDLPPDATDIQIMHRLVDAVTWRPHRR